MYRALARVRSKRYEKGNLEIDSADIGIDTDGTGDYARSDELHVGKCKKENRTEQGARSYFFYCGQEAAFTASWMPCRAQGQKMVRVARLMMVIVPRSP